MSDALNPDRLALADLGVALHDVFAPRRDEQTERARLLASAVYGTTTSADALDAAAGEFRAAPTASNWNRLLTTMAVHQAATYKRGDRS